MVKIQVNQTFWPMPWNASQAVWAFYLLEQARNGCLDRYSGQITDEQGSVLGSWIVENVGNGMLWRVTIRTQSLENVWEGNSRTFYVL